MTTPVKRRRFVQTLGTGTVIAGAGCLGGSGDGNGDGNGNGNDDHDHGDHENGDDDPEGDAEGSEGLAYAFAPNTIAIIDPETGDVVDEITDGIDGNEWGDPQITHDLTQIFVIEGSLNQVLVIDTDSREIVSEVDIGPGATHIYHPNDDEIWAHADDEGTFYVIDTDSHDVVETVEAGLEGEGHGKLLYHEDFGSMGYATNVNDPVAHVIDLGEYDRPDSIELGEDGGTHYKAYAPQNGLAYFEYSDVTAAVDVDADEVVDELEFSGGMYLTPDEERMGVLDGDEIRFIDVTDEENEEIGSVTVDGGPDALRYYESDGTLYGFTANTMTPESVVIDVDELEEVGRLDAGDIERPDGAHHLHRSGVSGDEYFFTPAEADGTVAVIDMAERELIGTVEVEDGVGTVQYVGDTGTGYTGGIR
ncbi:hypothetical protein EA462_12605 [Natrarchaeobius halalkaliphilus]|uniref:YncE family protein n=1 Tax=Natrarchaeobius halalkaliphilus TaxID=1679091 RepID=A0A3N6M0N4_9EURY|nr:hypothetical protein [Natrarchaeobius halalkaliphilus]RQG89200.1 hypothetical protein EA462_12605 [Natrarchaeobius halalkaliphilus]